MESKTLVVLDGDETGQELLEEIILAAAAPLGYAGRQAQAASPAIREANLLPALSVARTAARVARGMCRACADRARRSRPPPASRRGVRER